MPRKPGRQELPRVRPHRIEVLEKEQAGLDAARKAKVYDILTPARRGDCTAAQAAHEKYTQQYGRRP